MNKARMHTAKSGCIRNNPVANLVHSTHLVFRHDIAIPDNLTRSHVCVR